MFFRLEIEDMPLNHAGVLLDFDVPAGRPVIPILDEKQPHLVAGAAVGGLAGGEFDHPAGIVPKPLHGKNVVSFRFTG